MSTAPAITGTISHGTLRTQDLIPAFADALHTLGGTLSGWDAAALQAFQDGVLADEKAEWLLEDLFAAIDNTLPEGWLFGAHEGDSSDFGIWELDAD